MGLLYSDDRLLYVVNLPGWLILVPHRRWAGWLDIVIYGWLKANVALWWRLVVDFWGLRYSAFTRYETWYPHWRFRNGKVRHFRS